MKKSIFTVCVPITSQQQAYRLKQVCLDERLPIWKHEIAFDAMYASDVFTYSKPSKQFFVMKLQHYYDAYPEDIKTQVTEAEFMELLKQWKDE